jgi:hypothetical protein
MTILIRLATVLTIVAFATSAADQQTITLSNGKKCGPTGTATSAAGKDLDRHKNRFTAPDDDQIDREVTLPAMLAPGRDTDRFDQEKGAVVAGYVINVKPGGVETCNCKATAPVDRDTHIELALSAGASKIQRVIVEVTPRLRAQMKEQGNDWTTPALESQLKGKWIEVTGWLLFDSAHVQEAENTNPGGKVNWRATCWEIHPITAIKVLAGPPQGLQVDSAALAQLQGTHRAHALAVPTSRDQIQARNEAILKQFDEEERELEDDTSEREAGANDR